MTESARQRRKGEKAAEPVARILRNQIIRGELAAGESLPPESVLVERFGVSRPTLREAFRVLEAESLLVIRRGAGGGGRVLTPRRDVAARYAGFILQHQGTTTRDVYDARVFIEAPCVAILAERRKPGDVAALRAAIAHEYEVEHDYEQAVRVQTDFHQLVVELVGNDTMTLISDILQAIIVRANVSQSGSATSAASLRAQRAAGKTHRAVVDMIEAGDAAAAEDLWRRHLDAAEGYIMRGAASSRVLDLLD